VIKLVADRRRFVTKFQPSCLDPKFALEWDDLNHVQSAHRLCANSPARRGKATIADFQPRRARVLGAHRRPDEELCMDADGTPPVLVPRWAIFIRPAATLFETDQLGIYRRERTGKGSKVSNR